MIKGDDPVGMPMSKGTIANRGGWEPKPQKNGFAYSLLKQDQLQELHLAQTRFRDQGQQSAKMKTPHYKSAGCLGAPNMCIRSMS